MERLKFQFEVVAAEDPKSNVIAITSITNEEDIKFHIPRNLWSQKHHAELTALPEFKKVTTTLTKRGHTRSVWFNLSEKVLGNYKDGSGNMVIGDYLLEESQTSQKQQITAQTTQIDENLLKILEKLSEHKEDSQTLKNRNLSKISEKFVIEKFNGKNVSVKLWLSTYESECDRLNITKDVEKIEILRLFLEDNCRDWHSSMLIRNTLNSEWRIWRENFLGTFADKGWSPVMHAINYRFLNGSLLDYALRKERLLLETNKEIDRKTLINLIAAGLPAFVRDKIDREDLENSKDLFNELRRYEKTTNRKITEDNKEVRRITKSETRSSDKKPCKICEEKGKKNRYHPENLCWYKAERNGTQNRNISTNSILEVELNTEDQKN
ncbi:uncharacterized protein LOC143378056 [Andrena cerasifolii]|uniref:uncharacterized protein LOC143374716 n=1 Tax=Andrena cerasifolii TaxID=2819439 RepID=UPI004037DA61